MIIFLIHKFFFESDCQHKCMIELAGLGMNLDLSISSWIASINQMFAQVSSFLGAFSILPPPPCYAIHQPVAEIAMPQLSFPSKFTLQGLQLSYGTLCPGAQPLLHGDICGPGSMVSAQNCLHTQVWSEVFAKHMIRLSVLGVFDSKTWMRSFWVRIETGKKKTGDVSVKSPW